VSRFNEIEFTEMTTEFSELGLGHRFVTSASLSRVFAHGKRGFFILSPFRDEFSVPGEEIKTPRSIKRAGYTEQLFKENWNRYRRLQATLRDNGLGYIPLLGKWKDKEGDPYHEELSVFVPYRPLNSDEAAAQKGPRSSPALFFDFFFNLMVEYDQTAGIYCAPPENDTVTPRVELVYSGLRDEPANTSYPLGVFKEASVRDYYVSALIRATKAHRASAGGSGSHFKYESPLDDPADPGPDIETDTIAASFAPVEFGVGHWYSDFSGQVSKELGVIKVFD